MALDYKLDHVVKFSEEIEHKGLYTWCLKEFDQDEKQVGSDQIPWGWGLNFTVADLAYHLTLEQERSFTRSSDKSTEQLTTQPVVKKESLYGRLVPEKSGPSAFGVTRYSFFGTDRKIADFSIRIVEGEEESIDVWGSPNFEYETDFVTDTSPDNLQVTLVLKSDHFRDLVELVKSNAISHLSLRLSRVSGLYSDWSPSISVDDIKVLPAGNDDGKVLFPDENERPIPRLGKVGEYRLHIDLKKAGLEEHNSSDDDEDRYDVRQDGAFTEKLKKLFRKVSDEKNEDEPEDDVDESESSKDEADDAWRYSPLIRQFCIIYNQARMSLIRSGKSNRIDNLFYEIECLTYDFRRAVGQGNTDKKNSYKSYKSNRPQAFFWSTRNLTDVFQRGNDSSSAFPEEINGFDDLDSVAQEYFSGRWKSSYLEKILCEAFISLEAWLYARSIKGNITNLAKGRAAVPSLSSLFDDLSDENIARKNNYNLDKMNKAFLKRTFTRFGQRLLYFVGLPALVGVLAYGAERDWSGIVVPIAVGVSGIYIAYHTVSFILQLIFAGIRKGLAIEAKENGWERAVKLFSRMAITNRELSEGNALPFKVLKLVEKDNEEGISYRSSLFSILLRASDDKNYIWGTENSEL